MLNFDGDLDVGTKADVKCKQSIKVWFTRTVHVTVFVSDTLIF